VSAISFTILGNEPATLSGVPLIDMPPPGDEAALIGVLAEILVDLCAMPVSDALALPRSLQRQEAA
jgi:hypothetical protein